MPNSDADALAPLADARRGSREALGQLLDQYRHYLLLIARRELAPEVRAKGGASDLVQETFLEAQRDFAQFQGDSQDELLAWLRQLLFNNLANFVRRYRATGKRQVTREVSLEGGRSGPKSRNSLPGTAHSPGDQLIAKEQARRVRQALERLPEEYREVLLLRCRDDRSFQEIGQRMNRSKNAAQKLWARALERLKRELGASS